MKEQMYERSEQMLKDLLCSFAAQAEKLNTQEGHTQ